MSKPRNALQYEPIQRLPRKEALAQMAKGGADAANALYCIALHDEDDAVAFETCLNAFQSNDQVVRFAAVGALGEMAFFAGRSIDFELAEKSLKQLRNIYPELEGRVEDALDDLAMARKRRSEH
jgi:hypothetical protein